MNEGFDLRDIIHVLWESRFLITGIFMVTLLVGGVISFVTPPIYTLSSIISLGNFNDDIYNSQDSAMTIMFSDEFLLEVFKQLNSDMPADKFRNFKNSIKKQKITGSDRLIKISVETTNIQEGKEIIGKITRLFINKSQESYNERTNILSVRLAVTRKMLDVIEMDINQSRKTLMNIDAQRSSSENELRFSRMLEYIQNEESQHSSLMDNYLSQKKDLALNKNLEVIQEAIDPVSPISMQKTLILTVAGMLGLIIGIFAAFLRESLMKPTNSFLQDDA